MKKMCIKGLLILLCLVTIGILVNFYPLKDTIILSEILLEVKLIKFYLIISTVIEIAVITHLFKQHKNDKIDRSDFIQSKQKEDVSPNIETVHDIESYELDALTSYEQQKLINSSSDNRKNVIIRNVVACIEKNYMDPNFDSEKLASEVNYSLSYIRRLFKEVYNCSPTEYLLRYRLDVAKTMLIETDDSAKSISERVGYLNTKYFYKIFKKEIGMTSHEWRIKYGKQQI